ncbi:MAG: hypothetical protein IJF84_13100 [Thermoguttaceae bacterium]|nr:hypothetical protein [Thermoguttaceae bacterium]
MSQQTPQDIIDDATKQTLAHLKYAQVFNALLLLLIFCVGYIIVFAVVDAWVLPKGNQTLFRILGLSVFLIAIVWQLWRIVRFWLAFRVNPLYVAKTIEDLSPGMKNALINLTCFKMSDAPPPEAAVKLVEFQAARTILRSDLESSTDSARLLRHCIILLAVIAALGLYIVLSPKSFWQSSGRLFMPTAAIESPTRVRIQKVEPGDAQILVGRKLNISAEIKGISKSDTVEVIWSSVSGSKTNCRAEMTVEPGAYAYTCTIPDDEIGAQEDFTYCVSVGDAVSPQYKVTVLPEPSFSIEQIQYQYPEYTRLEPKTQTDSAEIQALEGTDVTIQIKTNRAVKQAYVKTEPDGRSYRMNVDDKTNASCSVALRWNEKTNAADQESWSVYFTDELGYENQPLSYPVAVVRDKPPVILKTVEQTLTIPPGSVKKLPIRVQDPDFGVGKAELEFQKCIIKDGQTQWSKKVVVPLYSAKPGAAPQKNVDRSFTLDCNKWKLSQGDTLIWRIIVQDNKQPAPNETRSEDYCIRIGTEQGEEPPQNPEDQKNEDANNPQPDAQDQNEDGLNSPDTDSNNQDGQPQEDSPEDEQEDGSENGDNAGQQQSGKQDGKQDGQQQDGQQDGQQTGEQNGGGEQGNQAGQEGNQAGQEGNQAGQEGNDGGQEGNQAGQEGNQSGQEGNQTGQEGNQTGQEGNQGGQQGNQAGDGGNSGEPIDPNSNPGDAIEEILKHKQESGGQNSSQPGEGQQDGQQDGEGQQEGTGQQDGKGQKDGTGQQDGQPQDGTGDKGGEDGEQSGKPQTATSEDGDLEDSGQPGEGEDLSGQKAGKSSVGSKNEGGSESEDPNKQLDTKGEKNAGKSGAGSQKSEMHTQDNPVNEIPEGEPIQQGENVKKDEGTEQPSSVGDPTVNDNNGKAFDPEQKGRNKGETANGGGMDSETRGNSNNGGQTPSDQGALGGNSGNEGTGQNAGDKVISDGAPGRTDPNKRAGAGREGNPESGSGDPKDSGTPQNGNDGAGGDSSGKQNPDPMDGSNYNDDTQTGEGAHGSIGGGLGTTTPLDDLPPMPPAGDADDVNVEYAQKQTVLALAHLKDQLDAGDDTLLKRLGWTKEQALEFIRRWEKMFADAKKNPKAKDELAQTLKSLGLRPAGYRATNARNADLQSPGAVRDAGRTAVPPQWSEAFEAFTSGLGEEP